MKKIFVSGFMHETNTFSQLPTTLDSYRSRSLYFGDEVFQKLRGTKTEIAAFWDVCMEQNWDVICPIFANATPGGKVTKEAFQFVSSKIVDSLKKDGPFDGVLLALHGAMVCAHVDDGEGELLKIIRGQIGSHVPIAITLDLHANVTDQMAELTNIIVIYRTYPHIDQYEVAKEAANLLRRTIIGEISPSCFVRRGKMLDGADHGRTTLPGPMTEAISEAKKICEEESVFSVSVAAGFPWVDIYETGPSVVIVGQEGSHDYKSFAEPIINQIFDSRSETTINIQSVDDAIEEVLESEKVGRPIVLSDFADNPGGGGYGDSTILLKAMIGAKIENAAFGTIYDPEAVQTCIEQGLGAQVVVEIGGKISPAYGVPIEITGKVLAVTDGRFRLEGPMMAGTPVDMGPTVVLKIGGIEVILTSGRFQVYDLNYFKHSRIDVFSKDVVAVKSAHHFRAAYEPIASKILIVDSGKGLTSRNYKELPYHKVRRPIYPLDID